MAALGWLLNLDFAASESGLIVMAGVPTITPAVAGLVTSAPTIEGNVSLEEPSEIVP